jgi:transcription elongation factor Elf1
MRAFVSGRCFWCHCRSFTCPECGRQLALLDVEDRLHLGVCPLCGPMDAECEVRTAPREEIFGAFKHDP